MMERVSLMVSSDDAALLARTKGDIDAAEAQPVQSAQRPATPGAASRIASSAAGRGKAQAVRVKTYAKSAEGRRAGAIFLFYITLGALLLTVASSYIERGDVHQSAYGEEWNDLGAFRATIKANGVNTTSLISSPLLLEEIQEPGSTMFVVSGVERDTISLPRFTGDSSLVALVEGEGYSTSEIDAIADYVDRGGTLLVMDDFGYSTTLASRFGLEYSGHQLYDAEAWARELDYNYIWMNVSNGFNYSAQSGSRTDSNPCLADADEDGTVDYLDPDPYNIDVRRSTRITVSDAGLCSHRLDALTGEWDFDPGYHLLLNSPSAFDKNHAGDPERNRYAIGYSSQDSYLDTNDDGNLTVGFAAGGAESDQQGPFALWIKVCEQRNCADTDGGRAVFVADGSLLINSLYDPAASNNGDFGKLARTIPPNDNQKWVNDLVAEALITGNSSGNLVSSKAQVIFDESRHQQPNVASDTYNIIYYILIYFTNDWMAMLFLFLGLFVAFEAVIIKKQDPEPWRHVFSIIYYGFGDARRYEYYGRSNKIKQVLLTRVRNVNSLSREEFDALPATELQKMIQDPVLVKFIFEDRRYSQQELVAVVKRVKAWGRA
jgi:hypothetical protein